MKIDFDTMSPAKRLAWCAIEGGFLARKLSLVRVAMDSDASIYADAVREALEEFEDRLDRFIAVSAAGKWRELKPLPDLDEIFCGTWTEDAQDGSA